MSSLLLMARLRGGSGTLEKLAPELSMTAVIERLVRVDDGFIIAAVTAPWRALLERFQSAPEEIMKLTPEQLEELIAASYDRAGFDRVTLTPRSGDLGRDVIAEKSGFGAIRILEQVKRYKPGNLVTAAEVDSLLGVLSRDPAASKGIVTTTSGFAPGCETRFAEWMPTRLELRNGRRLQEWLAFAEQTAAKDSEC